MKVSHRWYLRRIYAALAADGDRILAECEREITYTHDTLNLIDSYGYGVYYRGHLARYGFRTKEKDAFDPKMWYGEEMWGRDEIEAFLKNVYKPKSKSFELVIAAAMPYGKVLETASSGQKRKYKVISMAYDKLQAVAEEIGCGYVTALTGGKI